MKCAHRRYPGWFLPVFVAAGLLTVTELVYPARAWVGSVFRNYTEARHRRNRIVQQESVWFNLSPKGGRFLVEYIRDGDRILEVTSAENDVLWSRPITGKKSVFSRTGEFVFSGGELLDAEMGKTQASLPVPASATVLWENTGKRAIWDEQGTYRIWDSDSKQIREISREAARALVVKNPTAWE